MKNLFIVCIAGVIIFTSCSRQVASTKSVSKMLYNETLTEARVQKYINFFGYTLDGLKTIGLSYQVGADSVFWIGSMENSKRLKKIYYIPTSNTRIMGIVTNVSAIMFLLGLDQIIPQLTPDPKITSLELPIDVNIIPAVIQNFPNIQVIGIRTTSLKREARIQQIRNASTTYPNISFVVFVQSDPPEPKLPNVEYRSLSLDYVI